MGLVIGSVGLVTDRWGRSLVWLTEWWGGGGLIVLVSGGGIWFDFGFDCVGLGLIGGVAKGVLDFSLLARNVV